MISIVVPTFGRFRHIVRLVESAELIFPKEAYEIIAVCSDDPESEKFQWLLDRDNVLALHADHRKEKRLKSLYAYENRGIKLAQHEWIFVTNDDTRFHPTFYSEFLKVQENFDVILVKGHIGDISMGPVIPVVGEVERPGHSTPQPLHLYDFTLIRREIYREIGYLDEALDWFGKGIDLALAVEFKTRARILHQSRLAVDHFMALEEREPPDFRSDFAYMHDKWERWCADHSGYRYTIFNSADSP